MDVRAQGFVWAKRKGARSDGFGEQRAGGISRGCGARRDVLAHRAREFGGELFAD